MFVLENVFYLHLHSQNGDVAQLVEHRTENPCVGGSNPLITTQTFPNGKVFLFKATYFFPFLIAPPKIDFLAKKMEFPLAGRKDFRNVGPPKIKKPLPWGSGS
jgi:hypothetical protein